MQGKYTALFRKMELNGNTYYQCDFVVPEFAPNERFDSLQNRMSSDKSQFYVTATEEQLNKRGIKPKNIFVERSVVSFSKEEYDEELNISRFWSNHSPDIEELLIKGTLDGVRTDETMKYLDSKYDMARQAIREYKFINKYNSFAKEQVFIEMINREDKKYTSYNIDTGS